jgi:hypothetical protein
MTKYIITIPIAGYVTMSVEAENEEDAIDEAFQEASLDDIDEWDVYSQIVEGNILHAPQNSVEVEVRED